MGKPLLDVILLITPPRTTLKVVERLGTGLTFQGLMPSRSAERPPFRGVPADTVTMPVPRLSNWLVISFWALCITVIA